MNCDKETKHINTSENLKSLLVIFPGFEVLIELYSEHFILSFVFVIKITSFSNEMISE